MPSTAHFSFDFDRNEFENIREYIDAYVIERTALLERAERLSSTWLHEAWTEIKTLKTELDPNYEY